MNLLMQYMWVSSKMILVVHGAIGFLFFSFLFGTGFHYVAMTSVICFLNKKLCIYCMF